MLFSITLHPRRALDDLPAHLLSWMRKDSMPPRVDYNRPIGCWPVLVWWVLRVLRRFVQDHCAWVYGLLFLIVFCETAVVTPFRRRLAAVRPRRGRRGRRHDSRWSGDAVARVVRDNVNSVGRTLA